MTKAMCRATGINADGQFTTECRKPHGHEGDCEWRLTRATDADLRAECERRGIWGSATEALLRKEEMRNRLAISESDRDEWKRRAEAAEASRDAAMTHLEDVIKTKNHYIQKAEVLAFEQGKGIATHPTSEPHAHLDEDLLCEDA